MHLVCTWLTRELGGGSSGCFPFYICQDEKQFNIPFGATGTASADVRSSVFPKGALPSMPRVPRPSAAVPFPAAFPLGAVAMAPLSPCCSPQTLCCSWDGSYGLGSAGESELCTCREEPGQSREQAVLLRLSAQDRKSPGTLIAILVREVG